MTAITIVGGGNGAFAAAADLSLSGHRVTILEHGNWGSSVETVSRTKCIDLQSLKSSGCPSGAASLELVTTDPERGLQNSEVVLVVVPAYGQKAMASFCAPFLTEKQTICLMPGNAYGAVEFFRTIRREGNRSVKAVAELECLIYTATRGDDWVRIRGFKRGLGAAVFPSDRTEETLRTIRELYPTLTVRSNVLATAVSNPNVFLHTPLTLLNLANVERGLDMNSYHGAFTRGVVSLVEALDSERMSLASLPAVVGSLTPVGEMIRSWYAEQGASGDSLYEIMTTNPLYKNSKLPKTTGHRYVLEDVPYGLCPLEELLETCGLVHSVCTGMTSVMDDATGLDLRGKARTLASMGLSSSLPELLQYVRYGEG